MMSSKNILSVMTASALLTGAAVAAPKPPAIDSVETVCHVMVRDANGKVIGERTVKDQANGVVSEAVMRSGSPHSATMTVVGLVSNYINGCPL